MRSLVPKLLAIAAVLLGVLAWASGAGAAPTVTGAFELESELETNNKIIAGPEGNIWVTLDDMEKDVAEITPAGMVKEFNLGSLIVRPTGIAFAEGKVWVPLQADGVASFSPTDPTNVEIFEIKGLNNGSPLALGPDGKIWAGGNERIFRFSPRDPEASTEIEVPGLTPVDIDSAGSLVAIADSNATDSRIVTFTTGAIPIEKDYSIDGGSQGVAGSPSGQIGFSEQVPKSGAVEEVGIITPPNPPFSTPQPDDPFGVAYGADDAFWIVRAGLHHGLARLTSKGELSLLGGFPDGLTPRQITAGPNNTLWVTDQEAMKKGVIVRVGGLEPPSTTTTTTTTPGPLPVQPAPKPIPNTRIRKGPKKVVRTAKATAAVKFAFVSTIPLSGFQCRLIRLSASGKKATASRSRAAYATCRSPKVFRLAPGRYRFAVRAVSAEVADPTPAERSFRVVRKLRHR